MSQTIRLCVASGRKESGCRPSRRVKRGVHDGAVFDPDEGVDPDGAIRTGADRRRVPSAFEPLLAALVAGASRASPDVSTYLYGSVATGRAQVGISDVDLFTVGLAPELAPDLSTRLSTDFVGLSRGVTIGAAAPGAFVGEGGEEYGNRVFMRHYCLHLGGPDLTRGVRAFRADARAARGFNGDIGQLLDQWRAALSDADVGEASVLAALGRRVARKTLFAAASLVSHHDSTWTTDREIAAVRLAQLWPQQAENLAAMYRWSEGSVVPTHQQLAGALEQGGTVDEVVRRFRDSIGLWD